MLMSTSASYIKGSPTHGQSAKPEHIGFIIKISEIMGILLKTKIIIKTTRHVESRRCSRVGKAQKLTPNGHLPKK